MALAALGAAMLLCGGLLLSPLHNVKAAVSGGGEEEAGVWSRKGELISVPEIYEARCQECHGRDAAGFGPRHTSFIPEPANLTLVHDSPAMMTSIIKNGIQGTQMGAHPDLTDAQIREIENYVTSVRMNSQREWAWTYNVADRPGMPPPGMGEGIYTTSCAGCHGENGDGKSDDLGDPHVWPKPANFRARNSELGRVYYIVTYGRPGTMMGPQAPKYQSDEARWAVAKYVNSLWDPNSTATIPTGTKELYQNIYTTNDQQVVSRGSTLATLNCTYCHMNGMSGGWMAPDLTDRVWWHGGGTDNAVFEVVEEGIPGKLMPPNDNLPDNDRWAIITYIRSRGGLPDPLVSLSQAEAQ